MKKSSLILPIFSIVLIAAGVTLCFVGKAKGDVFDNTVLTEGDYIHTTDITSDLNNIVIEYSNAEINVIGGADRNYIETFNISDAEINTSKASGITISDTSDYFSLAYDTIVHFNGIRNILFPGQSYSGNKKINIYLTGDYNVTQLHFTLENGNINVSHLDSNTDYNFTIKGKGDVSFEETSTKSQAYVKVNEGNVTLKQFGCVLLEGNIQTGNLHCYEENSGKHLYNLTCENGMVYLLGESQGSQYIVDTGSNAVNIDFSVQYGNIHLNDLEKNDQPNE
ncbi:MAG: hypothetical protein HFE78_07570 [Clostridiales bacterium]|nr:hypothetical protein [Clostridiales bacterium]